MATDTSTSDRLSKLVLGTAAVATREHWETGLAARVLEAAYEAGVKRFDTAALYGGGLSEDGLGKLLKAWTVDDVRVSTKCGRFRDFAALPANQGGNTDWYDYSAAAAHASVQRSIDRLGDGAIENVFIHDADRHLPEALDGAYPALERLKAQGIIEGIGVASNHTKTIETALEQVDLDAVMLANTHSIIDPYCARTVLRSIERQAVGLHIAGPFLSGILATGLAGSRLYRYAPAPETVLRSVGLLELLCDSWGVSLRHCVLAYLARDERVSRVVVGATTPQQISETVSLFSKELPDQFWSEIDKLQTFFASECAAPNA